MLVRLVRWIQEIAQEFNQDSTNFVKWPFFQVIYLCVCMRRFYGGPSEKFGQNAWFPLLHRVILDPSLDGQWRIQDFQGGASTPEVGVNLLLLFGIIFAENCMKVGLRRGARPVPPPLPNRPMRDRCVLTQWRICKLDEGDQRRWHFLLTECLLKIMCNKVFY